MDEPCKKYLTPTSFVHLQIEEGIKKRFETTIIKQYGVDVTRNSTNKLITDAWDSMQRSVCIIRGSRKFCQRGSNFFCCFFS